MQNHEFLYCTPSVFVIGNEYEILINLNTFGICFVKVGEKLYYEENSGILPSERTIVKIRLPQAALDQAGSYEVIFRRTKERSSYWPTFFPPVSAVFDFQPLEKTADIHLMYVSDVHYQFELAKKAANYFGPDVDLFVVNGDIGEVETEQNYLEVCEFVGEIAGGRVPVIFSRGNHDTRGRLSALFTDYFPCQGKNTYYTFEIGCLNGLVLDCGEDKHDRSVEYDSSEDTPLEYRGVNRFHEYRERQLEFLKGVRLEEGKIPFAVSHVCPSKPTGQPGGIFDIDRELYGKWCAELDRIGPAFMLSGHYHRPPTSLITPEDPTNLNPHSYPVVLGAYHATENDRLKYWAAAVTLNRNRAQVRLVDETHTVQREYLLEFPSP